MLATIAVGFTAMLVAWRQRAQPGAVPLVALFLGACYWVICSLFRLQATGIQEKILWNELAWLGVMLIPLAWLLFAMEYTGRDRFIQAEYLAALALVPGITIVLALTSQSHSLLYSNSEVITFQGQQFLNRIPGPWFWVAMGYTYLLGMLGSIPILELVLSDAAMFKGQSGVLLAGTLAPWLSNVLFIAGILSIPAFDPTPIAFSISGVFYLAAVTQYQLFETNPSASQHAQRLFIDQLQEGALVVDSNGFIVDANENATDILGIDSRQALGQKAAALIDQYDVFENSKNNSERATIAGADTTGLYDITHTEITDSRGRAVGSIFTLHDVSDYVRNQQRHKVLNRLLRHNIRTKTNLIISHAELLAADSEAGDISLVKDSAYQIEDTAEKAREIVDIFEQSRHPDTLVALSSLVTDCRSQVEHDHPDADIRVDDLPEDVYVPSVLEAAYLNVIENAVVHTDDPEPTVRVRTERGEERVSVVVADNGPGIDDYEQSVIERGTEDGLSHSSGLGLWLVKWAAEIADGTIEFAPNSPSGTVVTITTPAYDSPAPTAATDERLLADSHW
jgi:PAS domain S-box-containing protein